ncbi:hypothetical protein I317_05439 [Kwoniella heveanensis CBS 569]|nr:hypothetical protein I317_05439 [Kwoniella heveanensis CBS 569]
MPSNESQPFTSWLKLPAETDEQRVPVDWDKLSGTESWKCLSLVRYTHTWIQPQLHSTLSAHSNQASHLLLLKSESDWSTTLILYPVSTLSISHNLIAQQGKIYSNLRRVNDDAKDEKALIIGLKAMNPKEERNGVKRVVELAKELIGGRREGCEPEERGQKDEIWDDLGVCTWESFLQPNGDRDRPTLKLLESLIPPFPVKSYLIDDGWQDVTTLGQKGRLASFEPWNGLDSDMSTVVQTLKARGIEKVGVWCTLQGYWYGIDPNSDLRAKYDCVEYKTSRSDKGRGGADDDYSSRSSWVNQAEGIWKSVTGQSSMWLPSVEKAENFWRDYFAKIKSWGIDFVKVDNQAFHETAIGQEARHIQQALWSGMLAALHDTWDTQSIIMCMSHNERMLNGPGGLNFDRPAGKLVFRNSDDFALNYSNAHPDHIHFNLFNSILTSHLFVPDFDMFASAPSDLLPTYHALLRALGTGPIFLSDTPRVQSDAELLQRLRSVNKRGRREIVRASKPIQALSNRWFWDGIKEASDGPALVGGTKFGGFGGIIAAWNAHAATSNGIAKDQITFNDIEDVMDLDLDDASTGDYIVSSLVLNTDRPFSSTELKLTLFSGSAAKSYVKPKIDVELGKGHCEAYIVSKLYVVEGAKQAKIAVLGMRDKFAALAGIGEPVIEAGHFRFTAKFADAHFALLVLPVVESDDHAPEVTITIDGAAQSYNKTPAKIVFEGGVGKEGSVLSFAIANSEGEPQADAGPTDFEVIVSFA